MDYPQVVNIFSVGEVDAELPNGPVRYGQIAWAGLLQ